MIRAIERYRIARPEQKVPIANIQPNTAIDELLEFLSQTCESDLRKSRLIR